MSKEKKPLLGLFDCPTCDFPEMEVRPDKNGHAFGYCPDCAQQLRTGNDYRSKKLSAKLRQAPAAAPALVVDPLPTAARAAPVTVTEEKPAAPPPAGKRAPSCLLDQ